MNNIKVGDLVRVYYAEGGIAFNKAKVTWVDGSGRYRTGRYHARAIEGGLIADLQSIANGAFQQILLPASGYKVKKLKPKKKLMRAETLVHLLCEELEMHPTLKQFNASVKFVKKNTGLK